MPPLSDILGILSHRPLKQKTINDLEDMYKKQLGTGGDITGIVWELGFRRTERSKRLYRQALKRHLTQSKSNTSKGRQR